MMTQDLPLSERLHLARERYDYYRSAERATLDGPMAVHRHNSEQLSLAGCELLAAEREAGLPAPDFS